MTSSKTGKRYGGKKGKKYPHLQRAEIRKCILCNSEFRAVQDYRKYKQKYCSKKCWSERGTHRRLKCLGCGTVGIPMGAKKYCSRECAFKHKQNSLHPQWKGDRVGYSAIHKWMTANYGKPTICDKCGLKPENKSDIHWASKEGRYTRELKNWIRLCRWCHLKYDGNDIKSNGGRWGK